METGRKSRPLSPNASILIVGGGVFGLSTALALSTRHNGPITLLDSSPTFPNPHGSSVDSSRIIRADYANPAYSKLSAAAIERWRTTDWGQEGRYNPSGLILVSSENGEHAQSLAPGGATYLTESLKNIRDLPAHDPTLIQELSSHEDVQRAIPYYRFGKDVTGCYVNRANGWADAEAVVKHAKKKLDGLGRVQFNTGAAVRQLVTEPTTTSTSSVRHQRVIGVELVDGTIRTADLVVLATGAWSGGFIDLRGRAEATGQALCYIRLTDEEQAQLEDKPAIVNFCTGIFIVPPRNNILKIGRHNYGYRNPTLVHALPSTNSTGNADAAISFQTSIPQNDLPVPADGQWECRSGLREMLPALADRPFVKTRVCWYTDTPTGDFIISYHPSYDGLFVATGGSGHAFKFFPVLGDKIVDSMQGTLDTSLAILWKWRATSGATGETEPGVVFTEDGSRSGRKGVILQEELERTFLNMGSSSNKL